VYAMTIKSRVSFGVLLLGSVICGASSQAKDQSVKPDPTHIPFALPDDIKWTVDPNFGEDIAVVAGDPAKPGLYVMLIKWKPGHFSTPHYHSTERYVYVVSGTWWVSSSDHFDPNTTYPLPAGSFATDLPNKVHWDGSKNGTVVLELVGMGPATTVKVGHEKK
jgi:hypothetical protein